MLLVFHNGSTVWIPPVIYKSSCSVNMADFPFDVQTCALRFGSWTYDAKKLDLLFLRDRAGFNMEGYVAHSEWEILDHHGERNVLAYACCDSNNYTDLTFSVTLKRRVTFHMRLILIPTVLLSAMSLAIFWIPANRPDRTSLGKVPKVLRHDVPPDKTRTICQYCQPLEVYVETCVFSDFLI